MSSSPYEHQRLGLLKKLGSLHTSKQSNKFENARLFNKDNKSHKNCVNKSIYNDQIPEKTNVIAHGSNRKYKFKRSRKIHKSPNENSFKEQLPRNITSIQQFPTMTNKISKNEPKFKESNKQGVNL